MGQVKWCDVMLTLGGITTNDLRYLHIGSWVLFSLRIVLSAKDIPNGDWYNKLVQIRLVTLLISLSPHFGCQGIFFGSSSELRLPSCACKYQHLLSLAQFPATTFYLPNDTQITTLSTCLRPIERRNRGMWTAQTIGR